MTVVEFNHRILNEKTALNTFALSLTRNTDDAGDLLQDTYLKALSYRSKYTDDSNLRAWLFTIMKNTFINAYRRKSRTSKLMSKSDAASLNGAFMQNSHNDSESRLYLKEIIRSIAALDPEYRVPFICHYTGFKYEEIARKMKLPLGTVKSRIFLARKLLMKELKHLNN